MGWFEYLKSNGYFSPEKNPAPVYAKYGFSMPRWAILDYLEKLAQNISAGNDEHLIDEIINIIIEVSKKPVDNYHTWYRLIGILSKMPNDRIPLSVLEYQPVWVSSRFDTALQTAEICEHLLPKFLLEGNNAADIEKAELIFNQLIDIKRIDVIPGQTKADTRSYGTPYDLYHLVQGLIERELIVSLAEKLDDRVLFKLIDQTNILLRDHERQFDFKQNDKQYYLILRPELQNLHIILKTGIDESGSVLLDQYVNSFSDKEGGWEINYFSKILIDFGLSENTIIDTLDKISFLLHNDLESMFGFYGIRDLKDEANSGYALLHTFSYLLCEWLSLLAMENSGKAINVLEVIRDKPAYQIPFFKRIILYVIAKNWNDLNSIFWKMCGSTDENRIFSNYLYKKELYQLLEMLQHQMSEEDETKLLGILKAGPQGDRHDSNNPNVWLHRWLQALKARPVFSDWFDEVFNKIEYKKDYAEEGKVQVRIGNVSPYTVEELTALSIDDLIHLLYEFRNRDTWNDPTVEGLAEILQQTIEGNPQKYTAYLHKFVDLTYVYVYRMLTGFSNAWKKNKDFDWFPVLKFSKSYLMNPKFIENKLVDTDEPRASKDWVIGQIGTLISEGTRSEEKSFPVACLPVAIEILLILSKQLKPNKGIEKYDSSVDFIMYTLNSTQGKVLSAVLDCSLKSARAQQDEMKKYSWEAQLKAGFELSLRSGIVDGYILQGMYLSQFMYLDDVWLKEQIVRYHSIDFEPWIAFMGGIAFGKPISGNYYPIMRANYERALVENEIDIHYHQGLLRHFLAFYFWDYDDSYENTYLAKLLAKGRSVYIQPLIQLINSQQHSLASLVHDEKQKLTAKVFRIWSEILTLYANLEKDDEANADLKGLGHFIDFIIDVNQDSCILIKKTILLDKNEFRGQHILMQLIKLINNEDAASYVGQIALNLDWSSYYQPEQLKKFITKLYDFGQNVIANDILTKLMILGHDYLKEIYINYNPSQ